MTAGAPLLFLHHGALGDQVLALPALAALLRRGPLRYAGRGTGLRVVRALLGVEALDLDAAAALRLLDLAQRRAFGRIVTVGRPAWEPLPGDPPLTVLRSADDGSGTPVWRRWLADLDLPPLPFHRRTERGAPRLLVAPGSGAPRKNWPLERFAALVADAALPTEVLLGPCELEAGLAERWRSAGLPGRLVEAPGAEELLRLFAGEPFFLGNDSGPAHLAGAHDLAGLVLFQDSDPAVWRPMGRRLAALGGPGRTPTLDEARRHLFPLLEDYRRCAA